MNHTNLAFVNSDFSIFTRSYAGSQKISLENP